MKAVRVYVFVLRSHRSRLRVRIVHVAYSIHLRETSVDAARHRSHLPFVTQHAMNGKRNPVICSSPGDNQGTRGPRKFSIKKLAVAGSITMGVIIMINVIIIYAGRESSL